MILFLSEGGLGNQIFQYVFLKTLSEQLEDKLVLGIGFDELEETFQEIKIINVKLRKKFWNRRKITRFIFYNLIYNSLFYLFNDFPIINFFTTFEVKRDLERCSRELASYTMKRGIFDSIKIVKRGFFQSEKFFDKKFADELKIKKEFVERAKNFLEPFENRYKVFVHIRLKDFLSFPVCGVEGAGIPPLSYFRNCIVWFKENRKNPLFVFLTDEPDFVEKNLSEFLVDIGSDAVISQNDFKVDFAIMTLCDGGILSPSSFAWWGAYFMRQRDVVFAPKFWLGFRFKIDYPEGTFPSFAIPVEISNS